MAIQRPRLIDPKRLPPGMQKLKARVPMRLATCKEVACPRLEYGWTEARGGPFVGRREVGIYHEPGSPCPLPHKVPSGAPPIYIVDGRAVVEDEFVQRLGEGVEAVTHIRTRGL